MATAAFEYCGICACRWRGTLPTLGRVVHLESVVNRVHLSSSAEEPPPKVGVLATIASVACAFFGVQSSRARRRDFTRGSPLTFLLVGLVMTAVFAGTLVLLVRMLMARASGG